MSVPTYDEPLPDAFGFNEDCAGWDESNPPKPLVELEMSRLSADIRGKPSWWTKFRDPEILAKWRSEALAQAEHMKESHVDYVSCYDRIWQSDKLIPAPLRERLISGVAKLENVPESEKDWHPRSDGQVLDLVHPSLYPIVYGRTLSYPEDSIDRNVDELQVRLEPPTKKPAKFLSIASWNPAYYISKRFQWLPTNFKVSDDGKSVESDGYVNNLHPIQHAELHKTIEDLISTYIPLFEHTLTDSVPENQVVPERTTNKCSYADHEYVDSPPFDPYSPSDDYNEKHAEWHAGRPFVVPEVIGGGYQPGSLEERKVKYTLGGRTIQVIVKLANIYLTPEKPTYPGGSWHIEGMKNESIAVSGIYYYDQENISESRLAFRTAVSGPRNYQQEDGRGCKLTWGMARDDPCVNELGSVITSQHRCIAFPNIYQHRVSPFELVDKSKPGHRKILALFLVDPAVRRPSTKIVPPQQKEWPGSGIASNPVLKAAFDGLPLEIVDRIVSMTEGLMTRGEAEQYRLELMDERKEFVAKNDEEWFMAPSAMCEH